MLTLFCSVNHVNHESPSRPTLRTSQQEHKRFLTGHEMVSSQLLPVTPGQARKCGSPKLELSCLSERQIARAAGNSMSASCVGAILLAAVLALDMKPTA